MGYLEYAGAYGELSEEVEHDKISHDSHMSTAPRNADSATYSP